MESRERPPLEEGEPKAVSAAQHIYTRVPTSQSPTKTEGWQTYSYTETGESALTANNVRRIESSLYHQRIFTEKGIRWQFFPLDAQRVVFTRVVPRSETDRSGKTFIYLAHSLVVPTSELKRLPSGLLSLWDNDLYVNELEEVSLEEVTILGKTLVNITPKNLKVVEEGSRGANEDIIPAELARLVQDLPAEQLIETLEAQNAQPLADLVRLIVDSKELVKNGKKVYMCGTQSPDGEIEQVLKLAVHMAELMPDADETSLSFTTWKSDNIGDTYIAPFWAVGTPQPPSYWWDTNFSSITLFAPRVLDSVHSINHQPVKELTPEEIHQQQLSHQTVMNALDNIRQKEVEMTKPQEAVPPQAAKKRSGLLEKIRGFLRES